MLLVEKKKEKKEIEEIVPIVEEPEKDDVLKGEDIMALAIKPEDLTKVRSGVLFLQSG